LIFIHLQQNIIISGKLRLCNNTTNGPRRLTVLSRGVTSATFGALQDIFRSNEKMLPTNTRRHGADWSFDAGGVGADIKEILCTVIEEKACAESEF
jgi:hypothetical protein